MDGLSETNSLNEADGEWLRRTLGIETRKDESSVVIYFLYLAVSVSLYHDLSRGELRFLGDVFFWYSTVICMQVSVE